MKLDDIAFSLSSCNAITGTGTNNMCVINAKCRRKQLKLKRYSKKATIEIGTPCWADVGAALTTGEISADFFNDPMI